MQRGDTLFRIQNLKSQIQTRLLRGGQPKEWQRLKIANFEYPALRQCKCLARRNWRLRPLDFRRSGPIDIGPVPGPVPFSFPIPDLSRFPRSTIFARIYASAFSRPLHAHFPLRSA
jgi:hypothetical protein